MKKLFFLAALASIGWALYEMATAPSMPERVLVADPSEGIRYREAQPADQHRRVVHAGQPSNYHWDPQQNV